MPDTKDVLNLAGGDNGSVAGIAPQPDSAFVVATRAGEEWVRLVMLVPEHEKRLALVANAFGELMEKPDRYYGVAK